MSLFRNFLFISVRFSVYCDFPRLHSRVQALPRRRRSTGATANLLLDLLAGESTSEQLISRYERYIACARHPALRGLERRLLQQRVDAVVEAVGRSGRLARVDMITALVCAVDGAVVSALVADGTAPRETARATLVDVIDVLAPIDTRV